MRYFLADSSDEESVSCRSASSTSTFASPSSSLFEYSDDEVVIGVDFLADDYFSSSDEDEYVTDDEEDPGETVVCPVHLSPIVPPVPPPPPLRRSSRERRKPVRFIDEYFSYYK